MKEPLSDEQIESNNQSGGGHQNSANEDRQKDAGSFDQMENIDNEQSQEGQYTQVVDAQSTKQKVWVVDELICIKQVKFNNLG